jgi:biotin-dependent carboxylase-like uncharacterized protein
MKPMKIFKVFKPGLFTTIQDLGRYGYLKYGVPISGAMDKLSLTAANVLVGNDQNEACLETTILGPELQTLASTQIAVTGGMCHPMINGEEVAMRQTLNIREGDAVSFGKMETGCRAYVSIRGGIDVPTVLGSKSTYTRGCFGGIQGRPLQTGDEIEVSETPFLRFQYLMPERIMPKFTDHLAVNVVLGPQAHMFTEKGWNTFLSSQYKMRSEADRMGYRLEGPSIEHKSSADIVSDALLPGAVQVPRNGKPIIIMRDAQTTGGYPKIAVATTRDADLLGQCKPNDVIEFSELTVEEAQAATREYLKLFGKLPELLDKKVWMS